MKQKVSLVLSGGGARGIAYIGLIEVLEEKGYEIVSVTGTSMGGVLNNIPVNHACNFSYHLMIIVEIYQRFLIFSRSWFQ